jgi:3-hydroxypropanoate dehydrogenase
MVDDLALTTPQARAAQAEIEEIRNRTKGLDDNGLDLLFRQARSHNKWTDKPVSDDQLFDLYALVRMGPTAFNGCPIRIKFLRSDEAIERLIPALSPGNQVKVKGAPVVAILAYDTAFYDQIPFLFAHKDVSPMLRQNPEKAGANAFRNSSMQGAYFIIAARAMGLDTGPMSGFDNAVADEAFFAGTTLKSNFLCAIGYGDVLGVYARNPRLDFNEACEIL